MRVWSHDHLSFPLPAGHRFDQRFRPEASGGYTEMRIRTEAETVGRSQKKAALGRQARAIENLKPRSNGALAHSTGSLIGES